MFYGQRDPTFVIRERWQRFWSLFRLWCLVLINMQLLMVLVLVVGAMCDGDDDGQYRHDDSGSYVHDFSGQYVHDDSGRYLHENGGNYKGGDSRFQNRNFGFQRNNIRSQPFPQARADFEPSPTTRRPFPSQSPANFQRRNFDAFGDVAAGTSTSPSRQFVGGQQQSGKFTQGGRNDNSKWRILRQNGDVALDGYHWDYETENGISAEESGQLANKGSNLEAMRAKGFYKYTGPDNVVYTVTYTADENGFVPVGNHLPTPPPIPPAILKSLELQKNPSKKF